MRFTVIILVIITPFLAWPETSLQDSSVDDIKVIKISAGNERAVIKASDKMLKMIKVGDMIGHNLKVTEIARSRVVIEDSTERGIETVIIRIENGEQTVERISNVTKDQGQFLSPQ